MSPFKNHNNALERAYNRLFKKEGVIIERCFGQLWRRFPDLKYKCRVKLEKVASVIICCMMLHDISKSLEDAHFQYNAEPDDNYRNGGDYEVDDGLLLVPTVMNRPNVTQLLVLLKQILLNISKSLFISTRVDTYTFYSKLLLGASAYTHVFPFY
nr:unnamed protein product [Callosobruchus analis]